MSEMNVDQALSIAKKMDFNNAVAVDVDLGQSVGLMVEFRGRKFGQRFEKSATEGDVFDWLASLAWRVA
jgi:hypothetical protein